MKRLAIGLFLLSCFHSANPDGFAQTQEQLIAGAKKEGKLVVYASATAPQLQMYFAAFNKKYPFIKTEFFRTGKQKLVSKILFEEQAKQHIADIIHTSVIETNILKKRGVLSRYVPNEAASYPGQYKDPEGYWTSAYASGTLLGFNSRQLKRAEIPKTYEDLLNPRWKTFWPSTRTRSSGLPCYSSSKAARSWKSSPPRHPHCGRKHACFAVARCRRVSDCRRSL